MFLTLGDLVVHCAVEGPQGAPPVLMLHSLGTDLRVWDPQAADLARDHRVIRPDLRGHGLSGATPGPGSMAVLAADALALLDALHVPAAHVAGLSIGGRIALEMAAAAPDRVRSLMLCDTALAFPPPESWDQRAAAARAGGTAVLADAVMARWVVDQGRPDSLGLRRMLLATDAEGYAAAAEALRDARAAPLAGRVRAPATVVVGELDLATPPASAEAIHASLPGSALVRLPGAGHIPTFEAAAATTAALRAHLGRHVPRAPRAGESAAEAGMAARRAVLGDAHVDRSEAGLTALDRPFRDLILEGVWGRVWTRPGLTKRERSLITLSILAALGHHEEFSLHARATRNTGASPEDVAEMLLHVASYAGVPAANGAARLAKEALRATPPPETQPPEEQGAVAAMRSVGQQGLTTPTGQETAP